MDVKETRKLIRGWLKQEQQIEQLMKEKETTITPIETQSALAQLNLLKNHREKVENDLNDYENKIKASGETRMSKVKKAIFSVLKH